MATVYSGVGDPDRTVHARKRRPLFGKEPPGALDGSLDLDVQRLEDCNPEEERGQEEGQQNAKRARGKDAEISIGVGKPDDVDR